MKKKSYFEVSSVVNRWLTVGLVLVIVSLMLSQWSSTFTAASDAIAGSFGKALNTFMRTAVGNGVVSVLFGVGHVLLLEFFRRGMRRSGDRFWVLVALWEVLIGASSLVTAVPGRDTLYAYAHNPTAWDSFRETFLLNYRVLAGMVQLLVSCLCIVRYRGRIRLFGITKLICSLLVSLVGVLFYNWALHGPAGSHPDELLRPSGADGHYSPCLLAPFNEYAYHRSACRGRFGYAVVVSAPRSKFLFWNLLCERNYTKNR